MKLILEILPRNGLSTTTLRIVVLVFIVSVLKVCIATQMLITKVHKNVSNSTVHMTAVEKQ